MRRRTGCVRLLEIGSGGPRSRQVRASFRFSPSAHPNPFPRGLREKTERGDLLLAQQTFGLRTAARRRFLRRGQINDF